MKFIADGMLGRVARWLRLMGYDTLYMNTSRKSEIIRIARKEKRLILTKDRKLYEENTEITFYVEGENTENQLKEIKNKLNLKIEEGKIFSICSICNIPLLKKKKREIKHLVPEYVYNNKEEFSQCPCCGRVYWQGDHCKHIKEVIEKL